MKYYAAAAAGAILGTAVGLLPSWLDWVDPSSMPASVLALAGVTVGFSLGAWLGIRWEAKP